MSKVRMQPSLFTDAGATTCDLRGVNDHFLFDGLRLALLRPSYRGRRAGVDSFRFLRLLMASPQSVFKVERCRPQRVPSWSREGDDGYTAAWRGSVPFDACSGEICCVDSRNCISSSRRLVDTLRPLASSETLSSVTKIPSPSSTACLENRARLELAEPQLEGQIKV